MKFGSFGRNLQVAAFLRGLDDLIPDNLLSIFDENELEVFAYEIYSIERTWLINLPFDILKPIFDKFIHFPNFYQNLGLKGQKLSKFVPIRRQIDPAPS